MHLKLPLLIIVPVLGVAKAKKPLYPRCTFGDVQCCTDLGGAEALLGAQSAQLVGPLSGLAGQVGLNCIALAPGQPWCVTWTLSRLNLMLMCEISRNPVCCRSQIRKLL